MASFHTGIDVLQYAITELKEAKNLVNNNCKVQAIQCIDLAIAAINAKLNAAA